MPEIIKVKMVCDNPPTEIKYEDVVFTDHGCSGVELREANRRGLSALFMSSDKEEQKRILGQYIKLGDEYNEIIHYVFDYPGFKEFFLGHDSRVSYEQVKTDFGREFADKLFSLRSPGGTAAFAVSGKIFYDTSLDYYCRFTADGHEFKYSLRGTQGDAYYGDNIIYFYDWTDEELYFGHGMYYLFAADGLIGPRAKRLDNEEMGFAIQDGCVIPAFAAGIHCMKYLEERGYMKKYNLVSEDGDALWIRHTMRMDDTVGFAILDPAYKKDKLLCERITSLYEAVCDNYYDEELDDVVYLEPEDYINPDEKFYFLQDESDRTYVSRTPGAFGGHKKLKIYGRLDCPSANRYVKKGQYVKHRVFFADESTAVAAGYRPCGVCMPEAYRKWKAGQDKQNVNRDEAAEADKSI